MKKQKEHAGTRLRDRRVELGLAQWELAEAIGTRQEGISLWEKRGPKYLPAIIQLAEALDCEPAWLAFGVGPKRRT